MVCVYCSSPTMVVNSRHIRRSNDIWRRRKCTACDSVFTSIEKADLAAALRLEPTTKVLEPFSRDRLFVSIYESCRHRTTALRDAANLTQQIVTLLVNQQEKSGLVTRGQLIAIVKQVLSKFDRAAATYYTAYHSD